MRLQIELQGLEIAEGALRLHKTKLLKAAGRIVDEDEEGAWIAPLLKPTVIAAVDLH